MKKSGSTRKKTVLWSVPSNCPTGDSNYRCLRNMSARHSQFIHNMFVTIAIRSIRFLNTSGIHLFLLHSVSAIFALHLTNLLFVFHNEEHRPLQSLLFVKYPISFIFYTLYITNTSIIHNGDFVIWQSLLRTMANV